MIDFKLPVSWETHYGYCADPIKSEKEIEKFSFIKNKDTEDKKENNNIDPIEAPENDEWDIPAFVRRKKKK